MVSLLRKFAASLPYEEYRVLFFLSASIGDEERQFRPDSWVPPETMSDSEQRHLLTLYSLHKSSREKKMEGRILV